MTTQQLQEAVECLEKHNLGDSGIAMFHFKNEIKTLLAFAQTALALKGMPEDKEVYEELDSAIVNRHKGYNQANQEWHAYLAKLLGEGLELREINTPPLFKDAGNWTIKEKAIYLYGYDIGSNDRATAIRRYFGVEGK